VLGTWRGHAITLRIVAIVVAPAPVRARRRDDARARPPVRHATERLSAAEVGDMVPNAPMPSVASA
jgi:hypothetical protein